MHSNNPIQAVGELANIWSARLGRSETDPYFGLLPCQYHVHLYLNYKGDVGNGGHDKSDYKRQRRKVIASTFDRLLKTVRKGTKK